ncbi:SDR family NAD(P)-dependent oxidoreductase [Candidatus Uhrbacteria bacterium]|nr:SDR family NAD(P)-dependent oxidoreductase [Candidatus Uhrbacteria bacterium]
MDIKNIVVTGGAGFIGSHLCHRLIKEGHRVICIDNLEGSEERNINHLFAHPHFEFLKLDVTQPLALEQIPELHKFSLGGQGIQEIYHLACPTSPKDFLHLRYQTLWANSAGMLNILELARKYSSKMLHASSSVVYGHLPHAADRVDEQDQGTVDMLGMRACYDEGKRFAETCMATYQQVHRLDAKIARIFRTYGPRVPINQGHMIPDFILAALDRNPLVIYGNETFETSLLYVEDLIDGLLKLMAAPLGTEPMNFGGEQSYRLKDVAQQVIALTQSSSGIEFQEPLLFMTPLPLPNISRAKEQLGWIPLTTLEEGLKNSIEYTLAEKAVLR